MRTHKGTVPVVVLARVGRTWSLFRPGDMVSFNVGEGREKWVTRLGLCLVLPDAARSRSPARSLLWRSARRYALWVLVVPAIAVTVGVSALTYGQTRFRAAAEPSLAVLAAVALAALFSRLPDEPVPRVSPSGRHQTATGSIGAPRRVRPARRDAMADGSRVNANAAIAYTPSAELHERGSRASSTGSS